MNRTLSHVIAVRDFASLVPRDFGQDVRESILADCLAGAYLLPEDAEKHGENEVRAIDEAKREATFVITDPSLDSYKEIIDAGAFDATLDRYMRNPQFLPEHQHHLWGDSATPASVGLCRKIARRGKALVGTFAFDADPRLEFPNRVAMARWGLYVRGVWKAVSVGFRALRTERDSDGVLHYTEALLKEVSTCAVPANENCLLVAHYVKGQLGALAGEVARGEDGDAGKAREMESCVREMQDAITRLEDALAERSSPHGAISPRGENGDDLRRWIGEANNAVDAAVGAA